MRKNITQLGTYNITFRTFQSDLFPVGFFKSRGLPLSFGFKTGESIPTASFRLLLLFVELKK